MTMQRPHIITVFLWLPNEEFAIARVVERVRMGGHNVPEDIIRRRYIKGMRNFFRLYAPLADTWFFYDNSVAGSPRLLASGGGEIGTVVENRLIWKQIQEDYNGG
jgi:predicted ABC-type ATPase